MAKPPSTFGDQVPKGETLNLEWLAHRYDWARRSEKRAAQRLRRAADAVSPRRDVEASSAAHLRASHRLMVARRELADATARVLVRRHRVACLCPECADERAAVAQQRRAARKEARRG